MTISTIFHRPDGRMHPFYIVLCDRKQNHVTKQHESEIEALEEAERLAREHHDRFFVLRAVKYVEPMEPPLRIIPILDSAQNQ